MRQQIQCILPHRPSRKRPCGKRRLRTPTLQSRPARLKLHGGKLLMKHHYLSLWLLLLCAFVIFAVSSAFDMPYLGEHQLKSSGIADALRPPKKGLHNATSLPFRHCGSKCRQHRKFGKQRKCPGSLRYEHTHHTTYRRLHARGHSTPTGRLRRPHRHAA